MKFTLFENLLHDDAYGDGTEDIKINITQANVKKLDDIIYKDAYGENLEETLNKQASLMYHYNRHVLEKTKKRTAKDKGKYDYMTVEQFKAYAFELAGKEPTFVIKPQSVDILEYIESYFNSDYYILDLDIGNKNKADGKTIIVRFNRKSSYSNYMEICLIEKSSGMPITIFPITNSVFYNRYIPALTDETNVIL